MTEIIDVKRNLMGVDVTLQMSGRNYDGFLDKSGLTVKGGVTREKITLSLNKFSLTLTPLQLLAVIDLDKDELFMSELMRRVTVQEQEIKKYLPSIR